MKFILLAAIISSAVLTSGLNASTKTDTLPVNHTSAEFKVLFDNHTGWTYNKNIYEVNIRQYTTDGTFNAFGNELPRLKDMGVGILWLMPINPIGVVNRIDELGSYYSVKDYEAVNPEFGSMDDFKNLVHKTHEAGMFVIVDWVANHTAWDNNLTLTHPDFYLLTPDGKFQGPPGMGWSDVIQLDYKNEELQTYMIETLKDWVINTGIDGFRFDYVDGVPTTFWKKAITELKKLKPDIFILAEGEGVKYHTMGFDMDYGWTLYGWGNGLSKKIYEETKTVADMDSFLINEINNYMPNKYHMYFTSTHDENSWQGTEFEQLGASAEVFAVLTQTFFGMPLVYSGQESGMDKRLKFFVKDDIVWGDYKYNDFYTTLNHLRDTNCALWNGAQGATPIRVNTSTDDKVFAYSRMNKGSEVLVFLNLSGAALTFTVNENRNSLSYMNIFSKEKVELSTEKSISLNAWGYLVLVK